MSVGRQATADSDLAPLRCPSRGEIQGMHQSSFYYQEGMLRKGGLCSATDDAPASRNRARKRRDSTAGRPDRRRGRDVPEREPLRIGDEVTVNAIFSPQTDGILVVLRPAPRRGVMEKN